MISQFLPVMPRTLFLGMMLLSASIPVTLVSAAASQSHEIRMDGMVFKPETIDAQVGDELVWVNSDLVPHTASALPGKSGKRLFDSGTIESGKRFTYKVRKAGVIDYVCLFHPTMKGKIRVKR